MKTRNSSIELLKIFSMFLIVISHVIQTLCTQTGITPPPENYVLLLGNSSSIPSIVMLGACLCFGVLGNAIFFVCSSWFLAEKKNSHKEKIINLILNAWVISVLFVIFSLIMKGRGIEMSDYIKSFFPTFFGNNWYVTCYILFLMLLPFLNIVLDNVDRSTHLRICYIASAVWILSSHIKFGVLFSSNLLIWITVYFCIAYIKMYRQSFCENVALNAILLIAALLCFFGEVVVMNFAGLKMEALSGKVLMFMNNANPFCYIAAIAAINLCQKFTFKSKAVNYFSSLTLFVYLFHENSLFRKYFRPEIWQVIYEKFQHEHIFAEVFIYAAVLFILSGILSAIYKSTVDKGINILSKKLGRAFDKVFGDGRACERITDILEKE